MKKLVLLAAFLCAVSGAWASGGGSSKQSLQGSYPIVLAHGILGFDDSAQGFLGGVLKYWGGLDEYLREQGVPVLTPGKTAMQGLAFRAQQQKEQIQYWMAANNYGKVHIIGHSQGGLDSRYMVSVLNMADKVASITSVNTPHRGSPLADITLSVVPGWLQQGFALVLNTIGSLIYGDNEQDIYALLGSMKTTDMAFFNTEVAANVPGVDYFSYGSYITFPDLIQHPLMGLVSPITWAGGLSLGMDGRNDGAVTYDSMRWGRWKGGPSTPWYTTGVDHLQATDWANLGQLWYDVEGYYHKMARNARVNQ